MTPEPAEAQTEVSVSKWLYKYERRHDHVQVRTYFIIVSRLSLQHTVYSTYCNGCHSTRLK